MAEKKPEAFYWKHTKEHRSAGVGGRERAFQPYRAAFNASARMRIEHGPTMVDISSACAL